MQTKTNIKALDLFAGAGGWDLAAADLGIEADGVEIMPAALLTREAAGLSTVHHDVWTFPVTLLAQYEMLIASPPCQTFAQSGNGAGRKALNNVLALMPSVSSLTLRGLQECGKALGDDRTALVLSPLWYALNMPSLRSTAWEQVPTVLPVWEAAAEVLRADGWNVWTGIVHSEQYGVPQARKRAVLIASLDHEVDRPTPTHSKYHTHNKTKLDEGVLPWVTFGDALGRTATPALEGDTLEDLAWVDSRPAPTMVGSFRPDIVAKPGYRKPGDPPHQKTPGSVVLNSPAESGILQSFPADHPWQGTVAKQYLQAGNAVPRPARPRHPLHPRLIHHHNAQEATTMTQTQITPADLADDTLSLVEEQILKAEADNVEVGIELRGSQSRIFGKVLDYDFDSEMQALKVGHHDGEQYVVVLAEVATIRVKTDPEKERRRAQARAR